MRESSRLFLCKAALRDTDPCGKDDGIPATKARVARGCQARRLANGESTRDVAKDFAVHHATIARLR
jgi:hypothetical protein